MVGRLESLLFWFMGIGVGLLVGLVLALAAWIGAKGVFRHIELLQLLDAENLYSSQQEQWSVAPLNCPACGASLTPYHGNCPDCDLLVNKHPKDFPVSTSSNQGYNFRYNYKKK
jgi:hypothetical protein